MHELALTQGLLDLVLSHAKDAGGGRVTGVHLVLGELSGAMEDPIQMYWEHLSRGTAAEGARLQVRGQPLLLGCRDCEASFPPPPTDHGCPRCGGRRVRFVAGDEMRLEAIDVEPAPVESLERSPQT